MSKYALTYISDISNGQVALLGASATRLFDTELEAIEYVTKKANESSLRFTYTLVKLVPVSIIHAKTEVTCTRIPEGGDF